MGKKFRPKEENIFLLYLDANNLYGWVMCQPLPTEGFKWVNDVSRFAPDEIGRLLKRDSKGYLLKVDVNTLKNYMICIMTFHLCVKR